MDLDGMVSSLWDVRAELAPQERCFVERMLRACEYTPAEAEEITRLFRRQFGHLAKIKGEQIDIPAGLEDENE